ncbi:MAG: sigma 54-interacting transcriptional regulator [Gammaproteobacteria bacterium]
MSWSPRFQTRTPRFAAGVPTGGSQGTFIEVTVSAVEATDEGRLCTIFLRDVNQREKAERELRKLRTEHLNWQEEVSRRIGLGKIEFIGDSAEMRAIAKSIKVVANTDATVLLTGETGTGKELIAKALHNASGRKDKLLIIVNCAALPSELIESELFGHEMGAFTSATAQRKGRFELADGGTIFLATSGTALSNWT